MCLSQSDQSIDQSPAYQAEYCSNPLPGQLRNMPVMRKDDDLIAAYEIRQDFQRRR